jgi:hypothetical protein
MSLLCQAPDAEQLTVLGYPCPTRDVFGFYDNNQNKIEESSGLRNAFMTAYSIDVCRPHCGGRLSIFRALNPPDAIRKILDCLGLPSKPPPISPAELQQSS